MSDPRIVAGTTRSRGHLAAVGGSLVAAGVVLLVVAVVVPVSTIVRLPLVVVGLVALFTGLSRLLWAWRRRRVDLVLPGGRYDIGVAMIHDQGHVAVKMLSPRGAAALTIGLPILFSSVAHGTSHDIAGQGRAEDAAMRCAINVLIEARERQ